MPRVNDGLQSLAGNYFHWAKTLTWSMGARPDENREVDLFLPVDYHACLVEVAVSLVGESSPTSFPEVDFPLPGRQRAVPLFWLLYWCVFRSACFLRWQELSFSWLFSRIQDSNRVSHIGAQIWLCYFFFFFRFHSVGCWIHSPCTCLVSILALSSTLDFEGLAFGFL